ncbi:hypothetical protein M5K25_018598 [Dendrobium thyrsiflorum]|uniref:Uncharacterized protein n=1 Tax=Dendrobium thyrsiflorum TaxID=117978 RepID=A0ABD0UID5_DENTH
MNRTHRCRGRGTDGDRAKLTVDGKYPWSDVRQVSASIFKQSQSDFRFDKRRRRRMKRKRRRIILHAKLERHPIRQEEKKKAKKLFWP